jgi:prefoldin subunit 5
MMHKVKDHKNLLRDPFNNAIISVDRENLFEHRNKTKIKENIEHINEEIASLKNDFQEIKFLLQQIANKG